MWWFSFNSLGLGIKQAVGRSLLLLCCVLEQDIYSLLQWLINELLNNKNFTVKISCFRRGALRVIASAIRRSMTLPSSSFKEPFRYSV